MPAAVLGTIVVVGLVVFALISAFKYHKGVSETQKIPGIMGRLAVLDGTVTVLEGEVQRLEAQRRVMRRQLDELLKDPNQPKQP